LKDRPRHRKHDALDDAVPSDPLRRGSGVQARAQRQDSEAPSAAATAAVLPLISLGAPANPSLLEPTYSYLSVYCSAVLSPRVADRVNVAIYELYANALRYGTSASEVRLELDRDERGVLLRITNSSDPANVARLGQQVARVRDDARAAFEAEMKRFGGDSQPPPMLGIVRVAHESQLRLDLDVDGARVVISTRCDD
jgi:hypothetical protein